MPAKKKKTKPPKKAEATTPRKSKGSLGMFNSNQRKQLESLGYVDKEKKKRK